MKRVIPMRAVSLMLGLVGLMLPVHTSYAAPITFVGNLSGANEIPVAPSTGTGFATVVLDPAALTLQINVTFSNLVSPSVAAHIHCCLSAPFALGNVGVATAVPAFPGFPLGGTSGTYSSQVFDLTQATIYNPAFVTAQLGLPQAEAALMSGILNGETYLNIHSMMFGSGEIRAFLAPVPEASSLVLFGSALFAFGLMRLRRLAARS